MELKNKETIFDLSMMSFWNKTVTHVKDIYFTEREKIIKSKKYGYIPSPLERE